MEQLTLIKPKTNYGKKVIELFKAIDFDESWSFEGCTTKDTKYITHGYHRYPAKFIPQLARRLIENYTDKCDLVVDPFMGSGTTLVEAKVLGRNSIGVDINDVAFLISKSKVTPIEPKVLDDECEKLFSKINEIYYKQNSHIDTNISQVADQNRIDYWFKPDTRKKLSIIYTRIKEISDSKIQTFSLCGFSHILKNCSIWLMKSNKPTRDLHKIIPDPYDVFSKHIRQMIKKNRDFWNHLQKNGSLNCSARPYNKDARKVPVKDESVALVVTSPPYVTSYEYADMHQLTALWFKYADNLSGFRKKFIGSAHNNTENCTIDSVIGKNTVEKLKENKTKKDKEVAIYFSEMRESFIEMHRYLKPGGKACIVIGNTAFRKVPVPNAEVFVEQMLNIGFSVFDIIKREIPSKILPSTRDPFSGRFTSTDNKNKTLAYPHEYIIIMEKK